jgi:3-deoxy-D-manno-octulosonic-acid transferase
LHLFFYNIFLLVYNAVIRIAALFNPKAKLWLSGRKGGVAGLKFKVQGSEVGAPNLKPQTSNLKLIWMHCASLGEFEQGRPLLEMIRRQYPDTRILLTFFSPSGYEVRKNYSGADHVAYLPMDSKKTAREFLDIIQPSLVLWVKYEYWYYFLVELKKRSVPTLLVSGIFRDDQPFFKWYGRLHRYMLESFSHFFVQTTDSKALLEKIGFAKNVTVSGDTRFDRVIEIAEQFIAIPLVDNFCGTHPVIVAGSTWTEDEEELDHYANTNQHIRFIIAPHEVHEEHIKQIERLFKNTIRYSQLEAAGNADNKNVLIIDNVGMLSKLYKYATITYVGGGFGDDGVHNVLEAAVFGKPVVFGPEYDKYVEAEELVDAGGGFPIENALELEQKLNSLLNDQAQYEASCVAARNYVYSKKGATKSILQYVQEKRLLTI